MKKSILSLVFLVSVLAFPVLSKAASPVEFRFGIEWLFSANFFNSHQFNYITEEGSRVNDVASSFEYTPNGGVYGCLGLDFLDRFNASLYSGYLGIYSRRNVIPLELRFSFFPGGFHKDGLFVNAGGGIAFQEFIPILNLSYLAHIGGGWRLALSDIVNLDFLLSVQSSFDHPNILNPEGTSYIPEDKVRKNNAQYFAVNFGLALSF